MKLRRRSLLKAIPGLLPASSLPALNDDPGDVKLAHRLNRKNLTDDDLLFLQEIGVTWVRLEFAESEGSFDMLREAQQRCARFGMRIYSGVHSSYCSVRVQLGQAGRDEDIATYCRFLRDLGKLGIPVASYDFHPANTYTTRIVQHSGYTTREFDLTNFRTRVEKPALHQPPGAAGGGRITPHKIAWICHTPSVRAAGPGCRMYVDLISKTLPLRTAAMASHPGRRLTVSLLTFMPHHEAIMTSGSRGITLAGSTMRFFAAC